MMRLIFTLYVLLTPLAALDFADRCASLSHALAVRHRWGVRCGTQPAREHAVSCAMGGQPALRKGNWKLIAAANGGGAFNQGSPGLPPTRVPLYNLAEDLGETRNLVAGKPELVAEMQALLAKLIRDGRSTPGERQKNDVEVRRHPLNKLRTTEVERIIK